LKLGFFDAFGEARDVTFGNAKITLDT